MENDRDVESILKEHDFLIGMSGTQVHTLAKLAQKKEFEADDPLIKFGETADRFFLIRLGRVQVQITAPHKGVIPLYQADSGDILGWSWMVPPHHWRFDAIALEKTITILFDAIKLRALMNQDHDLGYNILRRFSRVIAKRVESSRQQMILSHPIPTFLK